MWDFFDIIIAQLSETFKWFITGFFATIVILILLYKNNLLSKTGPLSFIKKIIYYLFFPLYIGIISWFFSATLIVEKEAKELAKVTIQKAQDSIFPQFSAYILSLADNWIDVKVESKEELVTRYLIKFEFEEDDYSTKAMKWTLINGLGYLENQAIENGSLQVGDENVNFPQLISNYLSVNENNENSAFGFVAGMTIKTIHNYLRSFYWTFLLMALAVVIILALDIYFTLKGKQSVAKQKIVPANSSLKNTQDKLENSELELGDNTKKIE